MTFDKKILDYVSWYANMDIDIMINDSIDNSKKIDINPSKAQMLENLKARVLAFDGCNLKLSSNKTVFGDGIIDADYMLIGEAPGATEDELGIPFCGESGKLLDNALGSINLSRKTNVYITNTVFWRPPANRRPTLEEIKQCQDFLEEHIAIINPKLLILVGATAIESVYGNNLKLVDLRQKYLNYRNKYLKSDIMVTAIFHPAYLLRNPQQKREMWFDLIKIKELKI